MAAASRGGVDFDPRGVRVHDAAVNPLIDSEPDLPVGRVDLVLPLHPTRRTRRTVDACLKFANTTERAFAAGAARSAETSTGRPNRLCCGPAFVACADITGGYALFEELRDDSRVATEGNSRGRHRGGTARTFTASGARMTHGTNAGSAYPCGS